MLDYAKKVDGTHLPRVNEDDFKEATDVVNKKYT